MWGLGLEAAASPARASMARPGHSMAAGHYIHTCARVPGHLGHWSHTCQWSQGRVWYKTLALVTTGHYTLRKTSHQGENSACVALAGAGNVGNGMHSVLLDTSPATAPPA